MKEKGDKEWTKLVLMSKKSVTWIFKKEVALSD